VVLCVFPVTLCVTNRNLHRVAQRTTEGHGE
jgi:hypothetical protein